MGDLLQIQEKIKQFIVSTSYISEDQISYNSLIFAEGIMDSMGFISIIEFIEENFSITVADNELVEANFESIQAIASYVSRKLL
jgi:acyl carrier protein